MKPIYWKHTPIEGGKTINATLVINLGKNRTYRVTFNWDRSYSFQTNGEIAVLDGAEFHTVLYLRHHDLPLLADYDNASPPSRGEFERAGKLPALVRQQADELAELGRQIVDGVTS